MYSFEWRLQRLWSVNRSWASFLGRVLNFLYFILFGRPDLLDLAYRCQHHDRREEGGLAHDFYEQTGMGGSKEKKTIHIGVLLGSFLSFQSMLGGNMWAEIAGFSGCNHRIQIIDMYEIPDA